MPVSELNARLAQALYDRDVPQVLALLTPGPDLTEEERPARLRSALDEAFRNFDHPMVNALVPALLALAPSTDPVWRHVLHQPILAGDLSALTYLLGVADWGPAHPAAMAEALLSSRPDLAMPMLAHLDEDAQDTVLTAAVMMSYAPWVERCLDLGQGAHLHKGLWDTLYPHANTGAETWQMMEESLARLPAVLSRRLVVQGTQWPPVEPTRYPRVVQRWQAEDRQAALDARPASPHPPHARRRS